VQKTSPKLENLQMAEFGIQFQEPFLLSPHHLQLSPLVTHRLWKLESCHEH
jgi:hypothetical protein